MWLVCSVKAAFPKPKDVQKSPESVHACRDGREACRLNTKAGRDDYQQRLERMHERQKGICPLCRKRLNKQYMVFDHDPPRGMGGGSRDDRIEIPDFAIVDGVMTAVMKWQNQAVHPDCNIQKGSRRVACLIDVP